MYIRKQVNGINVSNTFSSPSPFIISSLTLSLSLPLSPYLILSHLLTYFKEFNEWYPINHFTVQFFIMRMEKKLSQRHIKKISFLPIFTNKIQTNFITVTPSEKNFRYPLTPGKRESLLQPQHVQFNPREHADINQAWLCRTLHCTIKCMCTCTEGA